MRRLLIRPGAIGDCILSFPALQYLKADYTEVWVPSAIFPLIDFADEVRPINATGIELVGVGDIAIPEKLTRKLQSFDHIVSWYGANRPEFGQTLLNLGIRCEFRSALPPVDFRGHATDFFLQQLGASLGLIPQINVCYPAKRSTVVIHPFSGGRNKNWPLPLFRELAAQLPCPAEWTAGPEEEVKDATRFDNLRQLADWIAGARLYIGNDSGITHLAAATGTPTLALFGPTNPSVWAPRGDNVTVLKANSIEEITVEAVFKTANRLLG